MPKKNKDDDQATTLTTEKAEHLLNENARLSLQLKDALARLEGAEDVATRIAREYDVVLATEADRKERELVAAVDSAIGTYRDAKKLKDSDRPHLLSIARADFAAFRGMFPEVPPHQRYLLRSIAPPEPRPKSEETAQQERDPLEIMRSRNCSYTEALVEASARR